MIEILHLCTNLFNKEVILYCRNNEQKNNVNFYVNVFFKNAKIDFSVERLLNDTQAEITKVFEANKDFIENTAKKYLQDAVDKYLEDTSTTMFLYTEDENIQKMYVLNQLQETQIGLKRLLIDWYSDKWRVLDISWSVVNFSQNIVGNIYSCDVSTTVVLPTEECSISVDSSLITNCGWNKVEKIEFVQ